MTKAANDHYELHRAALAPLLPGAGGTELEQSFQKALTLGEEAFIQFLLEQGLGPLWDEKIYDKEKLPFSQASREAIHQSRLFATGAYLIQRHSLGQVKSILDNAGIEHVVTKGSHTRETYYATPALRPAQDIDILIRPDDKIGTIKAFIAQGFEYYGVAENIAQDCSLIKGSTAIDLHWDILRPGRTRQPMVDQLLRDRIDYGSHWGMNPAGTLFLMLVHPVFRKYTTTPHASLVRLIDMELLLQQEPDCVEKATELLAMAGLRTAGWITATWLHMLTGNKAARELGEALQPGRLRKRYLLNWLQSNRSSTQLDRPILVQLGFTLPAHDRVGDATRALWQAGQCRRESQRTLAEMGRKLEIEKEESGNVPG